MLQMFEIGFKQDSMLWEYTARPGGVTVGKGSSLMLGSRRTKYRCLPRVLWLKTMRSCKPMNRRELPPRLRTLPRDVVQIYSLSLVQ